MLNAYLLLKINESINNEDSKESSSSKKLVQEKRIKKKSSSKRRECRVCLKVSGKIPLFGENNDGLNIAEAILSCCDINIQEDEDNFPKYLCLHCYDSLLKAFQFRTLVKENDALLKSKPEEFDDEPFDNCVEEDKDAVIVSEKKPPKVKDERDKRIEGLYEVVEKGISSKRKVVCKLCNKIYTAMYIKSHIIGIHFKENERKHVCEICGKAFMHLGPLSIHIKQHSNVFPYKCTSCPFQAKYKNLLTIHMRHHSGVKKYMCSECPSRYYTASNLSKHMRTHQEPRYKCDYCERKYRCKNSLIRHIEIHMGIEKQFTCIACGNVYSQKKELLKHEIKKHGRQKNTHSRLPTYLKEQKEQNEEQQGSTGAKLYEHFVLT